MLLLLLRDLRLDRICVGYGRNKGFGKVRLESAELTVLTAPGGLLASGAGADGRPLAGFTEFNRLAEISADGWLESQALTSNFRNAVNAARAKITERSQQLQEPGNVRK